MKCGDVMEEMGWELGNEAKRRIWSRILERILRKTEGKAHVCLCSDAWKTIPRVDVVHKRLRAYSRGNDRCKISVPNVPKSIKNLEIYCYLSCRAVINAIACLQ
jgi:hypothetical protein